MGEECCAFHEKGGCNILFNFCNKTFPAQSGMQGMTQGRIRKLSWCIQPSSRSHFWRLYDKTNLKKNNSYSVNYLTTMLWVVILLTFGGWRQIQKPNRTGSHYILQHWKWELLTVITVPPLFLARRYASLNFVMRRLSSAIIKITTWPNFGKWKIAAGAWITCIQLQYK